MKSIFAIAKYTIIEQIRNRLYLIILFFGGLILTTSLLLGALAPDHKVRVVMDVGLLTLELFGLASGVFGAVNLVLQEIESKTIYLILTRPVNRTIYILGRYFGLVGAVLTTMLVMAAFHIVVMVSDYQAFKEFTWGQPFWTMYPLLLLGSILKMVITVSLAIFFSLFATSSVSALVFSGFCWVAGHFCPELSFLIDKSMNGGVRTLAHLISHLIPNYQLVNFRDFYLMPGLDISRTLGGGFVYVVGYSAFFLALSSFLFSRKEF